MYEANADGSPIELEQFYILENNKKRKATKQEIAQFKKDRLEAEKAERLLEAEQLAKEEARKSAISKLKALGLTDDETSALVS